MHTLDNYPNRNLDAQLMVSRLRQYQSITTDAAQSRLERLLPERASCIRNYKDIRSLDHEIGTLQLLLQDRERWSDFCCDDVSHWAGAI